MSALNVILYCKLPSGCTLLVTVTPFDDKVGRSFKAFWTSFALAPLEILPKKKV